MLRTPLSPRWWTATIVAILIVGTGLVLSIVLPPSRRHSLPFPNTTSGIHLALPFDYWVDQGLPSGTHRNLNGVVDYIWGASQPHGHGPRAALTSVHLDRYMPFDFDYASQAASGHSLGWFQSYHPSWVAYRCDRYTPAYFGLGTPAFVNNVPLDFTNPAVRAYQVRYALSQLARGYDGIAWDDYQFYNFGFRCGTCKVASSAAQPCPDVDWRASGYPAGSGSAKLTKDMLTWLLDIRARLKAAQPTKTIEVNFSVTYSGQQALRQILPYVDGVFDEVGFTNGGALGDLQLLARSWQEVVYEAERVAAAGKAFVVNAYAPLPFHESAAEQDQVINWALANYLLIKGSHTYTYVSHLEPGLDDLPQYKIPIGHPTSVSPPLSGPDHVYARNYTGGMALVNPSATMSFTVNLGRAYHDMEGGSLTRVTLPPVSGVVLLKPGA